LKDLVMGDPPCIGLVGGGVIGAGWAARFLLNGYDVAIFDPDPEIGRKLSAVIANARRANAKLFPGLLPPEGQLTIADSIEQAVAGADFVQESLPEREDLKQTALAAIDRATRPTIVVASSTSGLLPTRLQSAMAHPERFVVGHPFNPVYLLPLVEICGGAQTSEATKTAATQLYTAIGMRPLLVKKEIDGFVADRLLEALWREALWLVKDGVATTEEIDDAIRFGAGLRWSFMGTFLIYRMAGGEAGMRHFLAQFGPALKLPWTKLEAPELTDELIDLVSQQSDDQAAGVSIRDLEVRRDDCLIAVLSALRASDYGAGAVIADHQRRLFGRAPASPPLGNREGPAGPLVLHRTRVAPEWIDYNGHMTEARYLQVFAEATDAVLRLIGVDAAYLASGHAYFTVETHIIHRAELDLGAPIRVESQILDADGKRLHLFHKLFREADEAIAATSEHMLLHVDVNAGSAVVAKNAILDRLEPLVFTHRHLARPAEAGRHVGMRNL
jgi:carnitine 3-dehydrogenase